MESPDREVPLSYYRGFFSMESPDMYFKGRNIRMWCVIFRMSPSWESAQQAVVKEKSFLFTNPKKILLFPGLVSVGFTSNNYVAGTSWTAGH